MFLVVRGHKLWDLWLKLRILGVVHKLDTAPTQQKFGNILNL